MIARWALALSLRWPPEEDFSHCVPPENANELMHGAVAEDEYHQDDLDGPEMGPDYLGEQFLVAANDTAGLLPVIEKALRVVDEHRHQGVDRSFPHDVVSQRFVGVAVDERQHIGDHHCLTENERAHGDLDPRAC